MEGSAYVPYMTIMAALNTQPDTYSIKLLPKPWLNACSEAGLDTDAKIARHLGVNQSTICRITRGQLDPSALFIAKACKRLGRSFDQLFAFYVKASS